MELLAVRLREDDKRLVLLRGAFMLLVIRRRNMGLSPKTYYATRKRLVPRQTTNKRTKYVGVPDTARFCCCRRDVFLWRRSFIVLEYLAMGTLRKRLDNCGGGLGIQPTVKHGQRLASALAYMHDDALPGM